MVLPLSGVLRRKKPQLQHRQKSRVDLGPLVKHVLDAARCRVRGTYDALMMLWAWEPLCHNPFAEGPSRHGWPQAAAYMWPPQRLLLFPQNLK